MRKTGYPVFIQMKQRIVYCSAKGNKNMDEPKAPTRIINICTFFSALA